MDKCDCSYSHFIHFSGKKWEKQSPIVEKYGISTVVFSKMWIKLYNISHNSGIIVEKPLQKDENKTKLWINTPFFTQTYPKAVKNFLWTTCRKRSKMLKNYMISTENRLFFHKRMFGV